MRIEGEERKGEGINEFGEGGGEMADKEIWGIVNEREGKEMRWRAGKEYWRRERGKREGGGERNGGRMWRERVYRIKSDAVRRE
jgi:hypothetical protein